MAVSTRQQRDVSPVPPGRYWLVVIGGASMRDFSDWVRDMSGAVVVETSSLDQEREPPQQFVIFRVPAGRAPFLDARQFGFPNEAPASVTSIDDVEQKPPPEDPFPDFSTGALFAGGGALLVLVVLWALSSRA